MIDTTRDALEAQAVEWLAQLRQDVADQGLRWIKPHFVSSEETDTTLYEWWSLHRKISVYFEDDGIQILLVEGAGMGCTIDDYTESSNGIGPYRWLLGLT